MGVLLGLGLVFVLGQASYKKQDVIPEVQQQLDQQKPIGENPVVFSGKNEILRSKLNLKSQTFDDSLVPEQVTGCDAYPQFTAGNVHNFMKTLGLLPRGLYPEEGAIEAFDIYLDQGQKQIKLSLEGDESAAFKYKLAAFVQPEKDSEEPPVKIELAPENMVSLSKGEAIEAMKQEVHKFMADGAILGPRYLSLASEVKFDGDLHLARIDLVDNRVLRFQLNQKIACHDSPEGLSCVCYPSPEGE